MLCRHFAPALALALGLPLAANAAGMTPRAAERACAAALTRATAGNGAALWPAIAACTARRLGIAAAAAHQCVMEINAADSSLPMAHDRVADVILCAQRR
jgi:hypothetical protein